MSFRPVVPATGLVGWRFLSRTHDAQLAAFAGSPRIERDDAYFLGRIADVRTADDLVSDRRLLGVALGAFGLGDDIDNRAFVRKVLADGTGSRDALANRLTDIRYRRLSAAFGFGPGETARTGDAAAMAALLKQGHAHAFEAALGETDDTMRIALYAQRELETLAERAGSDDAKWFSVMGLPPLRTLFETALGLPAAFGQIDIDTQLDTFRDRLEAVTGERTIAQFADPGRRQRLIDLYQIRAQVKAGDLIGSGGSIALTLLRGAG